MALGRLEGTGSRLVGWCPSHSTGPPSKRFMSLGEELVMDWGIYYWDLVRYVMRVRVRVRVYSAVWDPITPVGCPLVEI